MGHFSITDAAKSGMENRMNAAVVDINVKDRSVAIGDGNGFARGVALPHLPYLLPLPHVGSQRSVSASGKDVI